MNPLILARLQFAITTVYHFFFVPLTLGLSVLVAVMETLYVKTGQETYKRMTKFWGKLLVINFAMGVVTGIVQEFQFGMNWSEYSRFVGDIFGAPLAIEALLAFFLESTFLGVWIFGWERLSKRLHATAIWLVAIASNLSALWILIANSFMQEPVGLETAQGKAVIDSGHLVMKDFFALVTNPQVWFQFPHTVWAGFTTAAFFMLGISAYHLLRKNETEMFQCSFRMAAIVGVVASISVAGVGHFQGQYMVRTQPMKMAAAEALWETEKGAGFSLFAIADSERQENKFSVRIPRLLSFLSNNRFDSEVKGLKDLQADYEKEEVYGPGSYIPPLFIPFWAFRGMVGLGGLMILIALYAAIFIVRGNKYEKQARMLKLLPFAIVLPYLANTAGWLLTEVGRYPWVVFGILRVDQAYSPNVTTGMLLTSLIGYVLIYGLLIAATVYLLSKYAKAGTADVNLVAQAEGET